MKAQKEFSLITNAFLFIPRFQVWFTVACARLWTGVETDFRHSSSIFSWEIRKLEKQAFAVSDVHSKDN